MGNTVDIWSQVWVLDCHTHTTPYPFPQCYGYACSFWSCDFVDMLIVGYIFVYNNICSPSNPSLALKAKWSTPINATADTMQAQMTVIWPLDVFLSFVLIFIN